MLRNLAVLSGLLCAAQANLIDAGNFEDGSWGKWQGQNSTDSTFSVVSPGFNSNHAGAHNVLERQGAVTLFYTKLTNLTVGRQYKFSADVKVNNKDCFSGIQSDGGILDSWNVPQFKVPIGEWVSYNVTYVPATEDVVLELITSCDIPSADPLPKGPTSEFDNLVFKALGEEVFTINSTPTGPNLLKEPNFESGTLDAYKTKNFGTVNSTVVSGGPHGAKNALRVTSQGTTGDDGVTWYWQNVKAKRNGVYKIGFSLQLVTKINTLCSAEAYIQPAGLGVTAENVPFQMPVVFPTPDNEVKKIGVWHDFEGVVSALDDDLIVAVQTICEGGQEVIELGDFQFVPLS